MSNVFTVRKPNSVDYQIDGAPDPTLTLERGETYTFDFIDNGHPFFIKSSLGSGTAGAYNEGVINQGSSAADQDLIFTVGDNAPDELFYQCSVHPAMNGRLNIVDATDQETETASVTQTVDLLVDAGVLADGPVYLKGLKETQSDTGQTVEYAGETFEYSDIAPLITVVLRDGEFTENFSAEIADVYPEYADITYGEAIALVGMPQITNTLVTIAGADGAFVT